MNDIEQIIKNLSESEKEIIKKAAEPESTILFNIKGMVQVLHEKGPFDFIEMGYEDIEKLKKKGLIVFKEEEQSKSVLQGKEFILSSVGLKVAKFLSQE